MVGLIIIGVIFSFILIKVMIDAADAERERAEILAEQMRLIEEYQRRVDYLREKYKDESIVQDILDKRPWVGETYEQFLDSFGEADHVQYIRLKNKSREVWHYERIGKGKYKRSYTLDDDVLCAWRF